MSTGDNAPLDENSRSGLYGLASDNSGQRVAIWVNKTTHAMLVDGSGSSITPLTATGAVDDSNTAFTFTTKPSLVVVNGASYRENHGWSWTAGTLTATLDAPVGVGGDIYGIT